jgi:hypothetical protein
VTDTLEAPPELRVCAAEGCETALPTSGTAWHFRKYCDEHQPPPKRKSKPRDRRPGGLNLNVQVGPRTAKKNAEHDAVRERALMLANLIAGMVAMFGQLEDSADLKRGSEPWADVVAALSDHEAWLRKLASGGEASERMMAWVAFAAATVAMALPILLRHEVLPAQLAGMVGTFLPTDAGGLAPPSTSVPKHAMAQDMPDGVAA